MLGEGMQIETVIHDLKLTVQKEHTQVNRHRRFYNVSLGESPQLTYISLLFFLLCSVSLHLGSYIYHDF
jgi:hypothetical protein